MNIQRKLQMFAAKNTLDIYQNKRNFNKTPEPKTTTKSTTNNLFVVQQHQAERAGEHFDFRLQMGKVLWSWAVPKAVPINPGDRRLAIKVEDHPLSYANFQGKIPSGEYGGGTVKIWDKGEYQPITAMRSGLTEGKLSFNLVGKRLHGKYHLIRMKQNQWLIFKGK